ncbi:MAG: hypothetical protein ABIP10_02680 [Ferruginibacter sp.]
MNRKTIHFFLPLWVVHVYNYLLDFTRYGMVWYGMVWYGMVWYGMVWYGMVWYGVIINNI